MVNSVKPNDVSFFFPEQRHLTGRSGHEAEVGKPEKSPRTTGEGEAALGTGSSQRKKTSPTPVRNGSIQEGPRGPETPWGVSVGGGWGREQRKASQK